MKTMDDYEFFCTPEQTKKAYDLGAPLEICEYDYPVQENEYDILLGKKRRGGKVWTVMGQIPSILQMRCWLRDAKNKYIDISAVTKENGLENIITGYYFTVFYDGSDGKLYKTEEEAIIAGIDFALDSI